MSVIGFDERKHMLDYCHLAGRDKSPEAVIE